MCSRKCIRRTYKLTQHPYKYEIAPIKNSTGEHVSNQFAADLSDGRLIFYFNDVKV